LSNLDPSLREHLRSQIRDLQRQFGFTGVYVTHDQSEAFYIGDRIALLSQGELVQAGTPDEIFSSPAAPLVARFAGATNTAEGELIEGGTVFASGDLGRVALNAGAGAVGDRRQLMVRPEAIRLVPAKGSMPQTVIIDRVRVGDSVEYALQMPSGARWRARPRDRDMTFVIGSQVDVELAADGFFLFEGSVR
jgi:ABC-type Fe3+/spermidine/putrescine transport system ATPase subunit